MPVYTFSKGKHAKRNEDYFGYNKDSFVMADGATDKSGKQYHGQTGGELVSQLIVREVLGSELNGVALVNYINSVVYELYTILNIDDVIEDPKFRFSGSFCAVRLLGDRVVITYLGDLGFRLNGVSAYHPKKEVDRINIAERVKYIMETGDIEGGRAHIIPGLLRQFNFQNHPDHPLGYGVIDGTQTPSKYVHVFEYYRKDVQKIELFTDGYLGIPDGTTVDAWEAMYEHIEKVDPYKYLQFPATKFIDDRTVMVIDLSDTGPKGLKEILGG